MGKLVYGYGINDADYAVQPTINGKRTICPFYRKWKNMLGRAYSEKCHKNQPTYIGTTVCQEWHSFMVFKRWMEKQNWKDNDLDKDILYPNNKHYSPHTCVFVTNKINMIIPRENSKGVHFDDFTSKFKAQISIDGKRKSIGRYETFIEAQNAYLIEKIKHIKSVVHNVDNHIEKGLFRHIELLHSQLKPHTNRKETQCYP